MASLQKKGKVWYGVFSENYKTKWFKLGKMSKHDAQKALAFEENRRERSIHKNIKKITFCELTQKWLEVQNTPDKKKRTIYSYEERLRVHLIPFFGNLITDSINPEEIEKFKVKLAQKVSSRTINYSLWLLRTILDAGVTWGYLYVNPARLVKKMKQTKKEYKILSIKDTLKLLDSVAGQCKVFLLTATLTGMRIGELVAMKWENLDWENHTYQVRESYSQFGLDKPKTETSIRKIDLSSVLIDALKKHKTIQNELRLKNGEKYQNKDLIFATGNGGYMNARNIRNRILYPAIEKAGLSKIRFHDLRGLYATLLLESGASIKYVQDQLGHKSPIMTIGIYAKVTTEARKTAQEKLQNYLFGE